MQDNGEPLVYMPLELKLNLTASPYIKTAGARMAKYEVDRTVKNTPQNSSFAPLSVGERCLFPMVISDLKRATELVLQRHPLK